MRKLQFFLVLFLLGSISLTSCQKDKGEISDKKTKSADSKITRQLLSFKQNLIAKSGECMSSDSAEWYLEGLLNYEQANNTHEFIQVEFLYDTLAWPAGNGVISDQDLQQVYASINELAQNMAQQNGNPGYTFNVIDLQVFETGLKTGEQAMAVTLSGGLPGTTLPYIGFGTDDYWTSGGLQGKCDIYTGQCIGRDATTELEDHFKSIYTIPTYFVSISYIDAHAWENEATDNPYGNYMMWMENSNHSNNCLSPGELNYYLSKWDYIKNKYKPEGKTFAAVDVQYNFFTGYPREAFYTYSLTYGVNIGSNPN